MSIVPTSVHLAVRLRGERQARLLADRQGVHVGPEGHRRTVASPAFQSRDHAILGHAGLNLQRQAVEGVQDLLGGLLRIEAEFGFPVDVASQGDNVLPEAVPNFLSEAAKTLGNVQDVSSPLLMYYQPLF